MRTATVHIHGPAGDLLSVAHGETGFNVEFELPCGLRDLLQSTGVPHVELGAVELNGKPADYTAVVDDDDSVEAWSRYPLTTAPDDPTFVLDVHLGRLARYLRLLGFDTWHDPAASDPDLAARSLTEHRILLTRDRGLLMRADLEQASFIRAIDPRVQITEVIHRFALRNLVAPLTRCLVCNGLLEDAPRVTVEHEVPSSVWEQHTDFSRCRSCHRVYWQGSHHARLMRLVDDTLSKVGEGTGTVAP